MFKMLRVVNMQEKIIPINKSSKWSFTGNHLANVLTNETKRH